MENDDLQFTQEANYTHIICKKCGGSITMKFLQTAPPTWVVKCDNKDCENHKPHTVKFPSETMQNLIPFKKLGEEVWK